MSMSLAVEKMRLRGISEEHARDTAMPISMQTRTLFNPAFNANYANFLVLGFIAIAIQLSALLAVSQAGAGSAALQVDAHETRLAAAAHVSVIGGMVWGGAWATVRLSISYFGLPMKGSEGLLALVILWFVANLAALGFGITCLARDAVFASEVCAIITMPNFLVSGFTWPVFAMPGAIQILAYALPMNPFVFALSKISVMGAGFADLRFELGLLAAWSVAAAAVAVFGASRLTGGISSEAAS